MEIKFYERKNPRLKNFNYSTCGAYFITICTHNRTCILSSISDDSSMLYENTQPELTEFGKAAEVQLLKLEERYNCLHIDRYVIMPNHIHAIFMIKDVNDDINELAGACSRRYFRHYFRRYFSSQFFAFIFHLRLRAFFPALPDLSNNIFL